MTYENFLPIVEFPWIEELNIGHSIIADALFIVMYDSVSRMVRKIKREK